MSWFGKENAKGSVPETVSDETWLLFRNTAAKQVPLIDGPWVDPKAAAKKRAWGAAAKNAENN